MTADQIDTEGWHRGPKGTNRNFGDFTLNEVSEMLLNVDTRFSGFAVYVGRVSRNGKFEYPLGSCEFDEIADLGATEVFYLATAIDGRRVEMDRHLSAYDNRSFLYAGVPLISIVGGSLNLVRVRSIASARFGVRYLEDNGYASIHRALTREAKSRSR